MFVIIPSLVPDAFLVSAGFGFNVVGGSDSQHLPGDSGIFVSLIKEDGVAARDGRLHEVRV